MPSRCRISFPSWGRPPIPRPRRRRAHARARPPTIRGRTCHHRDETRSPGIGTCRHRRRSTDGCHRSRVCGVVLSGRSRRHPRRRGGDGHERLRERSAMDALSIMVELAAAIQRSILRLPGAATSRTPARDLTSIRSAGASRQCASRCVGGRRAFRHATALQLRGGWRDLRSPRRRDSSARRVDTTSQPPAIVSRLVPATATGHRLSGPLTTDH